jgi:hypothetical protein
MKLSSRTRQNDQYFFLPIHSQDNHHKWIRHSFVGNCWLESVELWQLVAVFPRHPLVLRRWTSSEFQLQKTT